MFLSQISFGMNPYQFGDIWVKSPKIAHFGPFWPKMGPEDAKMTVFRDFREIGGKLAKSVRETAHTIGVCPTY